MRDRLNDRDIETILRGDGEELGLADFLARARSSAEWSPDQETLSRHVAAAVDAVTPAATGAPSGRRLESAEPAMKGIRLKIHTLTRGALTWIVAGATVLFGAGGALAAGYLPQQTGSALSNVEAKIGRNVPTADDLADTVTDVEERDGEDQILVAPTTVAEGSEGVEDTEPDEQSLIVVDENQEPTDGGCQAEDQDEAEVETTEPVGQQDSGELDEVESDQPGEDCDIEDEKADDQDEAEVEESENDDVKQISDVDDHEVESDDQTNDAEIDDQESEDDDHHSTDTDEYQSDEHESGHSGSEGGDD